jgi:murein DD-endopeptidase MepM/ murein hydrolase activator NlpD
MKEALGSEAALGRFHGQVVEQFGTPTALIEETVLSPGEGLKTYRRVERFEKAAGEVVTQWTFDAERRIAEFFVRPEESRPGAAESPHLEYQTRNRLRLPFGGRWYVAWGGREPDQNHHVTAADQRFAYDFLVRVDGASRSGDGRHLADYQCWGRPVLAPAAGEVVAAVDGLPDYSPGERHPQDPAGNHVVLDLGEGEFAVLAHLRRGSVSVAPGERLTAGQPLGRCGNSGHSSEPHLHFHLQDGPVVGQGLGLPAFFTDYLADGEPVERGEPLRGQAVEPRGGE